MDEALPDLRVDDFTDSLQPIADVVGPDKTKALVIAYGGQRLYIPTKWRAGLEMNDVVGDRAARELCDSFGPAALEIPLMPYKRSGLARLSQALHAAGMRQNEIARALGVSYKTIRRRMRSVPQKGLTTKRQRVSDERQIDLEDLLKRGS